jgi:hypothetical protein
MDCVNLLHNMRINKFHVTLHCTIFVIFSCNGQYFRCIFYYGVFLLRGSGNMCKVLVLICSGIA